MYFTCIFIVQSLINVSFFMRSNDKMTALLLIHEYNRLPVILVCWWYFIKFLNCPLFGRGGNLHSPCPEPKSFYQKILVERRMYLPFTKNIILLKQNVHMYIHTWHWVMLVSGDASDYTLLFSDSSCIVLLLFYIVLLFLISIIKLSYNLQQWLQTCWVWGAQFRSLRWL